MGKVFVHVNLIKYLKGGRNDHGMKSDITISTLKDYSAHASTYAFITCLVQTHHMLTLVFLEQLIY